jgi:hypothetical protein
MMIYRGFDSRATQPRKIGKHPTFGQVDRGRLVGEWAKRIGSVVIQSEILKPMNDLKFRLYFFHTFCHKYA